VSNTAIKRNVMSDYIRTLASIFTQDMRTIVTHRGQCVSL